jgi:lipid A ethanolaminephosphotransferase
VLWQGYEMKADIDTSCLSARASEPASHDNLFHTVLGMMSVQSSVYQPKLDVLSTCRRGAATS